MDERKIKLSLEQQFNLESFKVQVGELSKEESHILLVELYTNIIIREAMYKRLMGTNFNNSTGVFNGY